MCRDDRKPSLCDLPHCALTILFSHLDTDALYMLSQTCTFLKDCVEDPKYWKYIDTRNGTNSYEKFQYCFKRAGQQTTHLLLGGTGTFNLPPKFTIRLKPFTNLKIMALENQLIAGTKKSINDFPSCLEELSLRGSYVANKYFFQHSWYNFPKLKVIILDECSWLGCDALMSLSRYENLEIISVNKCPKIHIDTVPYLSVAKYCFKSLKVFDGRFTGIGGELLRTFYAHESIQRFYFQSFRSAMIDYGPDCENNIKKIFKGNDTDQNIADINLSDYLVVEPLDKTEEVFDSFLYQDPYPKCRCDGKGDNDSENIISELPVLIDDYLDKFYGSDEVRFVCRRHRQAIENLPKDVRDVIIRSQRLDCDSAIDNDLDSGEEEPNCCCLYGMDTKVIILPNVNNINTISIPDRGAEGMFNQNIVYFHYSQNRGGDENGENSSPSTSQNKENNQQESSSIQRQLNDTPSTSKITSENNVAKDVESSGTVNNKKEETGTNVESEDTTRNFKRKNDEKDCKLFKKRKKSFNNEPSTSDDEEVCRNICYSSEDGSSEVEDENDEDDDDDSAIGCVTSKQSPDDHNNQQPDQLPQDVAAQRLPQIQSAQMMFSPRAYLRNVIRHRFPVERAKRKISLQRLSLRGYRRITDLGLDSLKHLNMNLLDLTYTAVTKEGIENFLLYNPNCRIIHPLYCTCKPRNPF